ncbi:MAG: xanthine dehydrogenase family protein subunit M [Chloroflexota bacterium]|nr:xanthine dehydrogenase family protein subunit M [Chloroflexota bacterium]MDE2841611.1 xanthine dehydrogenase family protein subunit M [Chloroflexota bacterium]MDE2931975.1 xanthine dehydrogenase family protein subunit M [Chloroflexota bacterium]
MIPQAFDYYAPTSVTDALRLLRQHGDDAKLLAGGHSLLPIMKLRLSTPQCLIDLGRISDLRFISESDDGSLAIGAMSTYHDIKNSALVQARVPALAEAAGEVGDVQVQNKGTIGGSLAHADPAGDFPALALALNFELVTATTRSGRTIAIDRFFRDLLTTALRPNEILTEVHIPALPAGTGVSYQKLPNKASHYAVVGVAAAITVGDDGVCTEARIGVTGAGPTAVRARNTERILKGKHVDAAVIRRAAKRAGANVEDLNDDLHASAEYREHLTTVFAARAIEEALSRAG